MFAIKEKLRNMTLSELWIALILSPWVILILCFIYLNNIVFGVGALVAFDRENNFYGLLQGLAIYGIPQLFLIPIFYLTFRLLQTGGKVSQTIAWICLFGYAILLPIYWIILAGMIFIIGFAKSGGLH